MGITGTRRPAQPRPGAPTTARPNPSAPREDGRAYLAETARHRPAVHVQCYAIGGDVGVATDGSLRPPAQ